MKPMEAQNQEVKLRSLAPEFKSDHHDIYVRHLDEAVKEQRNRNIALTGRYGAGKSSVLDNFEKKHKSKTVRISINTLGPDEADEDLTNRIQKELVKQLVYRLKPGQVRRSRFARPKSITKWKALRQALGVTCVAVGFMWLLGVQPSPNWPGAQATTLVQFVLGLLFFALVVLVVWSVRWLIGDRIISEVTTAGAKIALGDGPTTYFDSFLDEIVSFFDAVEPEFVIFEDLDRFDDPQIFESLRELNTLVNASAQWMSKDQPIRFIYAIKDSLFEQLGSEASLKEDTQAAVKSPEPETGQPAAAAAKPKIDLATEAVRRANRTKFFEMVIPIVPFLSHRNARDHLSDALVALGFGNDFVSRPLLDLVAQHTTDMRLMINICNEFAVFVERLLWTENAAPGMSADHLFALVAYKNFHLADFEKIAQRTSDLDNLEKYHHDDVRSLIDDLQLKRRKSNRLEEHRQRRSETAAVLGQRLNDMKSMFPEAYPFAIKVGDKPFGFEAVDSVEFWERISATRSFTITQARTGHVAQVNSMLLSRVFPELADSARWREPTPDEFDSVTNRYDDQIAALRGADFIALAQNEYAQEAHATFKQRINSVLKSKLACDLVLKGFITRNYAEYSAIFYGSFVGVDVAYFYNHSVQPNEMYRDFHFTSENAVSNLLEQVPSDFTSSVSALNIEVVDHLLTYDLGRAKEIVAYIASHERSSDVQSFLDAYFSTSSAEHELLAGLLAAHPLSSAFDYLARNDSIPDGETRLRVFDAALLSAQSADMYELGKDATEFIDIYHSRMNAISGEQSSIQVARVFEILKSAKLVVPELSHISEALRRHVVDAYMYEISIPNLMLALGFEGTPTLDVVRKNKHVWEHCRLRIDDYLKVIQTEKTVECFIESEQVLIEVINEQQEAWTDDQLVSVIEGSAVNVVVTNLQTISESVWPMLVKTNHVLPSTTNVVLYVDAHGVDEHLSGLLSSDGDETVELLDPDEIEDDRRAALAIQFLNASEHLTAKTRVALAIRVMPDAGFDLASIAPDEGHLLAYGLEAGLFEDDLGTFAHFAPGGWDAMSEAFETSENVADFLSPEIVQGFVAEFLGSPKISRSLKQIVIDHLPQYITTDDSRALLAAGEFARAESVKLPLEEIRRVARVTKAPSVVARQLVLANNELDADEVIEILTYLGTPYDKFGGGPGMKFDHPGSVPSLDTVFKHLQKAGRIQITKKPFGSGKIVEVLV
ncbi:hypothetical protein CIK74_01345 [Glutamicibacter sp. BW77]|nr:hypothetical protein CIK74_01345 [Glutamicibacter sp. BW77]